MRYVLILLVIVAALAAAYFLLPVNDWLAGDETSGTAKVDPPADEMPAEEEEPAIDVETLAVAMKVDSITGIEIPSTINGTIATTDNQINAPNGGTTLGDHFAIRVTEPTTVKMGMAVTDESRGKLKPVIAILDSKGTVLTNSVPSFADGQLTHKLEPGTYVIWLTEDDTVGSRTATEPLPYVFTIASE